MKERRWHENETKWFQFHRGSINMLDIDAGPAVDIRFQFHRGSINITRYVTVPEYHFRFQFHRGSININPLVEPAVRLASFNSIEVRLIYNETCRGNEAS